MDHVSRILDKGHSAVSLALLMELSIGKVVLDSLSDNHREGLSSRLKQFVQTQYNSTYKGASDVDLTESQRNRMFSSSIPIASPDFVKKHWF